MFDDAFKSNKDYKSLLSQLPQAKKVEFVTFLHEVKAFNETIRKKLLADVSGFGSLFNAINKLRVTYKNKSNFQAVTMYIYDTFVDKVFAKLSSETNPKREVHALADKFWRLLDPKIMQSLDMHFEDDGDVALKYVFFISAAMYKIFYRNTESITMNRILNFISINNIRIDELLKVVA